MLVQLQQEDGTVLGEADCDVAVFRCGNEALLRVLSLDVEVVQDGLLHRIQVAGGHVLVGDADGKAVFVRQGQRVSVPPGMHAMVV